MKLLDRSAKQQNMNSFLTLPGERLVFAQRKHWFTLAVPIIVLLSLTVFLEAILVVLFLFLFPLPLLFLPLSLTLLVLVASFVGKLFVEWYFHFYLITSHKILEVSCSPLFSHTINDVLLDQVRCTEVDIRTDGFVSNMLDMGDITITFDRPTHQEEFLLADIAHPRKVGIHLIDMLDVMKKNTTGNGAWYKTRQDSSRLRFSEELFPRV